MIFTSRKRINFLISFINPYLCILQLDIYIIQILYKPESVEEVLGLGIVCIVTKALPSIDFGQLNKFKYYEMRLMFYAIENVVKILHYQITGSTGLTV